MASGYIYVLVNSSMPGLVKVGKTTRDPSQRVAELSGVTGVATPFIVAFEQFFVDCDAAEDIIHATLERQGLRQSSNREFFRAQTNDVIRVILQTPGAAEKSEYDSERDDAGDDDLLSEKDPLPDLKLEGWQPPKPWDDLLYDADGYYYGREEYLQDYREALELYKDAARLGSLVAYEKIGKIYRFGEGIREDLDKAVQYFKEGAKRGNYYCYAEMSQLFCRNGQIENFYKAFKQFLIQRNLLIVPEVEIFETKPFFHIALYLRFCVNNNCEVHFVEDLLPFADDVTQFIVSSMSSGQQPIPRVGGDPADASNRAVLKYIKNHLRTQERVADVRTLTTSQMSLRASNPENNTRKPSIFSRWLDRS